MSGSIFVSQRSQGVDFKNNYTTKQQFHQEYSCFLVEQFYLERGETKLDFLFIGWNKIVYQENKNILDEIVVSLFNYSFK